jgi:hypothetical protein
MEDNPQYRYQCEKEVEKCKLVTTTMQDFVGPIALITFNNDPLTKIISRTSNIPCEMEGEVVIMQIVKN